MYTKKQNEDEIQFMFFFIKINKFRAKAQKIIYAPYSDNYSQTVSVYVNRLNFILKK